MMISFRFLLALGLLPLLISGGVAQEPRDETTVESDAVSERLQQYAEQLRDDRFQVRQAGMQSLWEAGEAARPVLELVAAEGDREASARAKAVLTRFRYGLYVDTDPIITDWINSFRFGDLAEKRVVLDRLRDRGDIDLLVRLITAEPSPKDRDRLSQTVINSIQKYALQLPLQGAEEQWDRLLQLGAANAAGRRHYAVFLTLTGRDEAYLNNLLAKPLEALPAGDIDQLIWLQRARGDLNAAYETAGRFEQRPHQLGLAYEARRWGDLQDLMLPDPPPGEGLGKAISPIEMVDLETLGFIAAAQRLQGDHESFTRTMSLIVESGQAKTGSAFYAAEALMINGDTADGIAILSTARPDQAFRLLVRRGQFRQAFQLVDVGETREQRDEWFAAQTKSAMATGSNRDIAFQLITHVARALHAVGYGDEAEERLESVAKGLINDKSRMERFSQLSEAALRMGKRDMARRFAAAGIVGGRATQLLQVLFPSHSGQSLHAWRYLELQQPNASKLQRLIELEKLLTPKQTLASEALDELAERWLALLARRPAPEDEWRRTLAEIERIHAGPERAIARLAEQISEDSEAAMRVAELRIQLKQWAAAETALNAVLAKRRNDAPALYLRGWVRRQLGRDDEANKDIAGAKLAPLAVSKERQRLAQTLQKVGLKDEAVEQYRLLLRCGDYQEWYVNDAAKQIGNAISGGNQAEAAEMWERLLFSGFKRDSWFTAVEGYLQLTHLVHKTRGRALLKSDQPFAAFQQFELAHRAMPDDISLAEDVVPELQKQGHAEQAERLYYMVQRANLQIVNDFPDSAMHWNNLAWLSARCDRQLEDALQWAEKANRLRPETPSYIDTLGEVLFRMGRQDEAIRCAERCLALDPDNSFYRSQLERFQNKPSK